jgi:hypothetical protein
MIINSSEKEETNLDLSLHSVEALESPQKRRKPDPDIISELSKDSEIKEEKNSQIIFNQTKLLLFKNFLIFSRNLKNTIFHLCSPIIMCLIILLLQVILDNFSDDFINKEPKLVNVQKIPKCKIPVDCVTIGYGIIVN